MPNVYFLSKPSLASIMPIYNAIIVRISGPTGGPLGPTGQSQEGHKIEFPLLLVHSPLSLLMSAPLYTPYLLGASYAHDMLEYLEAIRAQIKLSDIPPSDDDPFVACKEGPAELFNAMNALRYKRNAAKIREILNDKMRKIIKQLVTYGALCTNQHNLSDDEIFEFASFFKKVMLSVDPWCRDTDGNGFCDAVTIATHTIVDRYINVANVELKTPSLK